VGRAKIAEMHIAELCPCLVKSMTAATYFSSA